MKDREFSIEDAYKILICFLPEFWWNFLKGVMLEKGLINDMTLEEMNRAPEEDKLKYSICNANEFVLTDIQSDLGGCGYYLEDIIEERMHVPPKQQHEGFRIKEDILFQLVIDWCHYFNRKFRGSNQKYSVEDYPKDSLIFAIEWLEDMRKNPKDHNKEWELWDKIIEEPRSGGWGPQSDFDTHINAG